MSLAVNIGFFFFLRGFIRLEKEKSKRDMKILSVSTKSSNANSLNHYLGARDSFGWFTCNHLAGRLYPKQLKMVKKHKLFIIH